MSKPDICVAIPTYRREKELINTIRDALRQSYKNLEVLVIDQSTEHLPETTVALSAITDKRFRYIQADPPSLPAARNFALKKSRAPIVLFLDDDVELHEDMVKHHLQSFKKNPAIGAVAGRVLQAGFPIKKEVLRFDEYGTSHGVFTATDAAYTNTFPGGNHAIKVADALAVGGYDTRFYGNAFREESDMAHKIVKAGKLIYYEPKAALTHLAAPYGGTRIKKGHIFDNPMFYRNELFFTLRAVEADKRMAAVKKKLLEYCTLPSRRQRWRRKALFAAGLLAALWRLAFGKQTITKERTA